MAAPPPPLRPGKGFCVQTESAGSPPGRWYVNMCKHKLIDMPLTPSGKHASKDYLVTYGLEGLKIPFDVGSFRKLKERADGAKHSTYCIDAVFNPFMVKLFMEDDFCKTMEQFRPYVIKLALKRIEESIGVNLVAQKVKLVKALRYKDGEDGDEDVPREFTELPGDRDCFDEEMPRKPQATENAPTEPLIQDVTNGPKKSAIKKGFLNKSKGELYGPEGSKEGVLPENAGDPMGFIPKKLRNTCKIIDCNSPEYQENERKKRAAETSNAENKEMRDELTKSMEMWAKKNQPDKWEEDLPEGTEEQQATRKYDVDYSRFNEISDVDDKPSAPERDWYIDQNGQQRQIEKQQASPSTPGTVVSETGIKKDNVDSETPLKAGFLNNTKKPLYPKGSEQRAPPTDEDIMKELKDLGNLMGPNGDHDTERPASKPTSVKATESKSPEFELSRGDDCLKLLVSVPALNSMQGVDLDVTERQASLAFPREVGLRPLKVDLPASVVPTGARAKFSKKTHQITISLPTTTQ